MSTFIKIPFPTGATGTLINTYSLKTIIKASDTIIELQFDDASKIELTNTSDSTEKTLKSFNDALLTARSSKSNPSAVTPVVLPNGISISAMSSVKAAF